MKDFIKKHWGKITAALSAALIAFLTALMSSCSSTQRITVEQEQGDQRQKTEIESDTKINELHFSFNYGHPDSCEAGQLAISLVR